MKSMIACACLCLLALSLAAPAWAEITITGSVEGAQLLAGYYVEDGGSTTPSAALRFPVETGDHETSTTLIEAGKAYFDGHKPLHVLASGALIATGQVIRAGGLYAVARGRDSIPTTREEWDLYGRLGLGASLAGGKAHVALCWRPNGLTLLHPDGLFISGVVWSN